MSLPARLIWTGHLAVQTVTQPRFPYRSIAAIERAQRRRIRSMIRHAYETVPYYRMTMDRLGLSPANVKSAADLARLPLIDRQAVQRDPRHFVSRAFPLEHCRRVQTGGSSGAPLTAFHAPPGLRATGYGERWQPLRDALAGRRWRPRVLFIASPMSAQRAAAHAIAQRILLPKWIRRQSREMSLLDPPAKALAAMNEFRPHVVHSYGSYLEALFVHAYESGADFHRPGVVVYAADALPESARRLISETLGIPVLSHYGAVEASPMGFECEAHRGYHLNVDLHPVRIADEAGEDVADGESGEIVVSNLVNRGTVLLNYRLGDVARFLSGPCPCGRSLPMISFLEGRPGDWVATRSGERMHPQGVRTLFTDEQEIRRYQVTQRSLTHFAVVLVTATRCDRERLEGRLAKKFAERLGAGTTIEVSFATDLPRTRLGKVRTVIGLPDAAERATARAT